MEKKISDKDEQVNELTIDHSQKQSEVERMKAKISELQLEITNISREKAILSAQLEESTRKYKLDLSVYSSKEVQLNEAATKIETYR